jgi:hypothetical protein
MAINSALIKVRQTLFSYQSLLIVRARPSLAYLLEQAQTSSKPRAEAHTTRQLLADSVHV